MLARTRSLRYPRASEVPALDGRADSSEALGKGARGRLAPGLGLRQICPVAPPLRGGFFYASPVAAGYLRSGEGSESAWQHGSRCGCGAFLRCYAARRGALTAQVSAAFDRLQRLDSSQARRSACTALQAAYGVFLPF